MNKREFKCVQYLLSSQRRFVSGPDLSRYLGLSDKTLRKIVKDYNLNKEETFSLIEVLPSKGYHLHILNEEKFYRFLEEEKKKQDNIESLESLEEDEDRRRYLLYLLLVKEEVLQVDDLYEQLYISESSLSKLLTHIRASLLPYQLKLKKKGETYSLEGEERHKRRAIMDLFLADEMDAFSFIGLYELSFFETLDLKQLYEIILDINLQENAGLSDYSVMNLLLHLALAIKRLEAGHTLERFPDQPVSHLDLLEKIIAAIKDRMGIVLPAEEASYIALHLLGQGSLAQSMTVDEEEVEREITEALSQLSRQYPKMFDPKDPLLKQGLLDHLIPMIFRVRNQIQLSNPLFSDVKDEYGEILQAVEAVFTSQTIFKEEDISQEEWAYVVLHILAAIERYQRKGLPRVLLLTSQGKGGTEVLKNRVVNNFGNRLTVVNTIRYYELSAIDFSEIDFIISSIDLNGQVYPCPVLQVSIFLNQEDIEKVEHFIEKFMGSEDKENILESEEGHALNKIFRKEGFHYMEEPVTKEEVLEHLVGSLSEGDNPTFKKEMIEQIAIREELGGVAFNDLIALPHPAHSLSIREEIAVALLEHPIKWDETHQNIRLVILISPSKWRNRHIKQISILLARLVNNQAAQEEILKEPSFEKIDQVLRKL